MEGEARRRRRGIQCNLGLFHGHVRQAFLFPSPLEAKKRAVASSSSSFSNAACCCTKERRRRESGLRLGTKRKSEKTRLSGADDVYTTSSSPRKKRRHGRDPFFFRAEEKKKRRRKKGRLNLAQGSCQIFGLYVDVRRLAAGNAESMAWRASMHTQYFMLHIRASRECSLSLSLSSCMRIVLLWLPREAESQG